MFKDNVFHGESCQRSGESCDFRPKICKSPWRSTFKISFPSMVLIWLLVCFIFNCIMTIMTRPYCCHGIFWLSFLLLTSQEASKSGRQGTVRQTNAALDKTLIVIFSFTRLVIMSQFTSRTTPTNQSASWKSPLFLALWLDAKAMTQRRERERAHM